MCCHVHRHIEDYNLHKWTCTYIHVRSDNRLHGLIISSCLTHPSKSRIELCWPQLTEHSAHSHTACCLALSFVFSVYPMHSMSFHTPSLFTACWPVCVLVGVVLFLLGLCVCVCICACACGSTLCEHCLPWNYYFGVKFCCSLLFAPCVLAVCNLSVLPCTPHVLHCVRLLLGAYLACLLLL